VAALAFLVILDLGYYPWGLRAEDLTRQMQQGRSE